MTAPTAASSSTAPRAEEVFPGVFSIACPFGEGGTVYVYFIDAPEPAVVDTGVKANPLGTIEPALNAAGKSLAEVRHIFNTHGHWDHMGGNEEARRLAPDARTYLHENDKHLLQTVEAHVKGYSSYGVRLLNVPDGLDQVDRLQRPSIDAPTPVDVFVADGQRIDLGAGKTIRVVTIPGHSNGSVSYLLEEVGALFTGDGIQCLGTRSGLLPNVFDDSRSYRASIAKVSELGVSALCMGHAFAGLTPESGEGPVRQGAQARTYLEESGEVAKVIEEAARSVLADSRSGDFQEFARRLFQRISDQIPVELDDKGMSLRSMPCVHSFYRELTGAPVPGD